MKNIISGMAFLYVGFTILGFASAGGGGIVITRMTSGITSSQTTIPVESTEGFLAADTLVVDTEYMTYSGKTAISFTGVARGINGTAPSAHVGGKNVYTESAGVINSLLGFNIAAINSAFGILKLITYAPLAFTSGISHLILFDYPMFDGVLVYLKYMFFAVEAIGLVALIFWQLIQSFISRNT